MTVDIEAYAGECGRSPYDQLQRANREYTQLLQRIGELFRIYGGKARTIADLGCGTGNVTLSISDALADVASLRITAVDASVSMAAIATAKIYERKLELRIEVKVADIMQADVFPHAAFDAINVTHALNYTGNPRQALKHIAFWLRPGGLLVTADIGRELVVANWRRRLLAWHFEASRRGNRSVLGAALKTLRWSAECGAAARANALFQRGQRDGIYPLHSAEEFCRWIRESGFDIILCESECYRDPVSGVPLDDLVVARKCREGVERSD
jgi:ubiquinone/menaquinone biosynthesis C-methylase UbiE